MRLAGQMKGGFYAAPPEAIAAVMERLIPPDRDCYLFDPCAGEGAAIQQIAQITGGTPYAVELSEDRAEKVRELFPDTSLAPASFFGCRISPNWCSLAWVNPPFDDEMGGGKRVEKQFVEHVIPIIKPGGILALVCPERVAADWKTMDLLTQWFNPETMIGVRFPEDHRPYNEVVVFGEKRPEPLRYSDYWDHWDRIVQRDHKLRIPRGKAPLVFKKVEMTEPELLRCLGKSRLRQLFKEPPELPLPRPPMSPGAGHRAMLLASGFVDGLVCPKDEPPHVVRGTCRKKQYVARTEEQVNEDDSTTTKTVYAEKMQLIVRALDREGTIHELMQE